MAEALDFAVMHPWSGSILLEAKGWRIDTLHSLNRDIATILTPNGTKTVENPLEQTRGKIANLLEQDR